MRTARNVFLILLAVAMLLGVTVYAFANAPEKGSMGVWGYVANADDATLEVSDQVGATSLLVKQVEAPGPAWIVVHTDDDGMPGERVGLIRIEEGVSRNVSVELEGLTSEKVIVAVHADKGEVGEFEFDMEDREDSPDRPFFVGGAELAEAVAIREFGVKDPTGTASIEVADQRLTEAGLLVARAAAPGDAWIVVHLNDDGMPGERVGLLQIPAGTTRDAVIEVDAGADVDAGLLVAVHADRGAPGTFEFDMEDKLGSPDQPFFVNGEEVATTVALQ